MLYCKYCGKECKNLNSLRQHEIRCKQNPNRIINKCTWKHIVNKPGYQSGTKGKVALTDGFNNKYLFPKDAEAFLKNNLNWYKGFTFKNLNGHGIASTSEKEAERKRKISETMKKNPLAGGRRIGSGRGKKGWYKGIYCDSSWELAFLVYYLDHNKNIKRCEERREYIFNNEKHIYIPDFVTDEGIIEIKGYKTQQWKIKLEQNSDIKVLYEDDIKLYLEYAITTYGKNYCDVLYEKHNTGRMSE